MTILSSPSLIVENIKEEIQLLNDHVDITRDLTLEQLENSFK